uniref:Sugar ABC transporter substrate-binding protein n=1 Tax=Candidatus Caldatribacterium californiense TaxID=1454726 RepID=A0A7V3YHK7_9BACT
MNKFLIIETAGSSIVKEGETMRRSPLFWLLVLVGGIFLSLPVAFAQEKLIFGYSAPGLGDEGQWNIQKGFVDKCKELGIEVIVTDAQQSAEKQNNDIETLIARGVHAICAVPHDSAAISIAVQKCNEAGIPFFTIDRGVTAGKVVLTVKADNVKAGAIAGEVMLRLLQGKYNGIAKGKVLEIRGQPGQDVAEQRAQGFHQVLEKYPDIQIISLPGYWNTEEGFKITVDTLTANPDLDGIYYHADLYIPGIVEGIKAVKGEFAKVGEPGHIFILGIDGNPAGLDQVEAKLADGVVVQPLRDYGALIVPIIVDYLKRGEEALPKPGTVLVEEGASWSPAMVVQTAAGLEIWTNVFYVDYLGAGDPNLWGNKPRE